MTRLISIAITVLFLIGHASYAHSAEPSWLEDAWSPETVSDTGGPSITLNAELGVIITLPAITLSEARASGISTKDAVRLFLDRYAQRCSDVIDLNKPQANLPVTLSLVHPYAPVPGLFLTDEQEAHFTVDYEPRAKANCVYPAEVPTS